MFFISPVKTLYSIKFYLQTLKEPLWKAFCFIAYLFVLGTIFIAIYIPAKLQQPLTQGVEKVADYVPNIKVSNGVITANSNERLVISPKELQGYKFIFDTASTEPAYPTQMQKENIMMYVNKDTVYFSLNGQFQENKIQKDFNFEISKDILLTNKQQYIKTISYILVIVFILVLAFRMVMLSIIALIVVFIINAATKANLGFRKILALALYLQGPVLILDLILLILPFHIVGINVLVVLLIYIIYLNLIFFHLRATVTPQTKNLIDEDEE
ncbi:MAG: DUF1189 family protein [Elusimicrobiaceae bacterium]|nr:DUF1189 family protein [Elusimicrobiaceae bacterium]